jgi:putative SOS response-associated peptidase YedK
MCARYTVFSEAEILEMRAIIDEISRMFGPGAVKTKGVIAPTDMAPVLAMSGGGLSPMPARFGFPRWDGKGVVFNARSETAEQKPMFARPLLRGRCVVPAVGFYEFSAAKERYFFTRPGEPVLYMAGMLSAERGAFVILTAQANASVLPVHHRMPVLLSRGEREAWLNDDAFMRAALRREGPELLRQKAG